MRLLKPKVGSSSFDFRSDPPLPALELTWDAGGVSEHCWQLPDGVTLKGAAPERFGVTIHRVAPDAYHVRVLWNRTCLAWEGLTRRQVMASSLTYLLAAIGTDLWSLLNQPFDCDATSAAA